MTSLTFLGSGAAVPTTRRGPPGLLLRTGADRAWLIDPGPGALYRAVSAGTAVEDIAGVFLTHHHPDHTLDVMSLLFARRSPLLKPALRELVLAGPAGTHGLYERMLNLYGRWVEAEEGELDTLEIDPRGDKTVKLPESTGLSGVAGRVKHTDNSIGYRFDLPDGAIALSGDSEACDMLVELGREADLLVLESSVPDGYRGTEGHMCPAEAGEVAARAGCRLLVLYHLYHPVDADAALASARGSFTGKVIVAEDGWTHSLGAGP